MRRKVNIKQHDRSDCGAASLASIAAWYGLMLPLIEIREACGTSENGTSIKGIIEAASRIGLTANAYKSSDKDLSPILKSDKPIILHIKQKNNWLHYIVLYSINGKRAEIMDPAEGKILTIPTEELMDQWTGYLITIRPNKIFIPEDRKYSVTEYLCKIAMANYPELLRTLIGSVIYIIIGFSISLFLKYIIDDIIPSGDIGKVIGISLLMTALMICSIIIGYYKSLFSLRAALKINTSLILEFIKKLSTLPLNYFTTRGVGEINSRIGDSFKVGTFISSTLTFLIISTFSLTISILVLFIFNWKLAILVSLFIPSYWLIYSIANNINKRVNREIIESGAKFQEVSVNNFPAIPGCRHFEGSALLIKDIEKQYIRFIKNLYRGGRNMAGFSFIADFMTKVLNILILSIGALMVIKENLSIGEFVSFFTIISFFTSPVLSLINSNSEINEAKISAERVFDVLQLKGEESTKATSTQNIVKFKFRLRSFSFQGVAFNYPGKLDLFGDLSFCIYAGKINIIHGDSGSGKSTIASILMRDYSPSSGRILLGEINIDNIPLDQWRRHISIVPQKIDLINGTILENIVLSDECNDIEKVLEICNHIGFNNLPEGIMTQAGINGSALSGGERQKTAIARALYREPDILILDEATSSLDRDSKERIITLIKKLNSEGMTIIMISHDKEIEALFENSIRIDIDR